MATCEAYTALLPELRRRCSRQAARQGGSRGRSVEPSHRFESRLQWLLLGMIQNWGWEQQVGAQGVCADRRGPEPALLRLLLTASPAAALGLRGGVGRRPSNPRSSGRAVRQGSGRVGGVPAGPSVQMWGGLCPVAVRPTLGKG